jgi:hypothetical protein
MRALSPARGLQPPLVSFKTPGRVPRRDAPSASPRSSALSARITRGLIHPLVFACLPFREDLRAGFPCALGHPWLVTLAPANWGPVIFRTRDVPAPWKKEYAQRKICPENKLCASCANALEIEWPGQIPRGHEFQQRWGVGAQRRNEVPEPRGNDRSRYLPQVRIGSGRLRLRISLIVTPSRRDE